MTVSMSGLFTPELLLLCFSVYFAAGSFNKVFKPMFSNGLLSCVVDIK